MANSTHCDGWSGLEAAVFNTWHVIIPMEVIAMPLLMLHMIYANRRETVRWLSAAIVPTIPGGSLEEIDALEIVRLGVGLLLIRRWTDYGQCTCGPWTSEVVCSDVGGARWTAAAPTPAPTAHVPDRTGGFTIEVVSSDRRDRNLLCAAERCRARAQARWFAQARAIL